MKNTQIFALLLSISSISFAMDNVTENKSPQKEQFQVENELSVLAKQMATAKAQQKKERKAWLLLSEKEKKKLEQEKRIFLHEVEKSIFELRQKWLMPKRRLRKKCDGMEIIKSIVQSACIIL